MSPHTSIFIAVLGLLASACAGSTGASTASTAPRAALAADDEASVQVSPDLLLRRLTEDVWMHTSWMSLPELGRVPSNGLVVLGPHEALLVDTAWTEAATVALLDYVEGTLARRVTAAVLTHSHDDRVAGVQVTLARGARVYALRETATRMLVEGYPAPTDRFDDELSLAVDGVDALVFFPGAAHAPDNVVVWLPESGVLFGSCLLRAADWTLGNLADASLDTWPDALSAIERRMPTPRIVVPGHGEPGGPELLAHTRALLANAP